MHARNKKTMTLVAGIAAAGAVVAATLPANAADKGDASPSREANHKTMTGNAIKAKHAAPGASTQRVTGDACSSYADGHGDLCLWYLSNYAGSRVGFLRDDANMADDRFRSAGSGQTSIVTNNAESAWNYDSFSIAYLATSPNYTGSVGFINPDSGGNLSATYKNNTESLYWSS